MFRGCVGVVAVAFQSAFHLKKHANKYFFLLFLKLFLRSAHQNDLKTSKTY